MIGITPV